ncbi:MAG: hypothetical protein L0Y44_16005 [Phycisphaerales bacterium]|nr:hypothetical protein [Phycisphaerales bacterium]MCI0632148.1 hypothetical protein [Phycisphaerales bacterium]MCI0676049.1 hypothetical protein [Phycisphaerales bacterium]
MNKSNIVLTVLCALLAVDIVIGMGGVEWPDAEARAQSAGGGAPRLPVALSAAPTKNDNFMLYRMWSDGSIDVRLVNPMLTQATDWPESDKAGISFQEKWKVFQVGP